MPNTTKIGAKIREEETRVELSATLNTYSAYSGLTKEEYHKEYRATHSEEINRKQIEYYQTHREEIIRKQREYDQTHKEEKKKNQKEYRAIHREEINRKQRESRAMKKALISPATWRLFSLAVNKPN